MSGKRKMTKRRDADAVRVYPDGRLAYWTGGKPGAGERKFERHDSVEQAEARAEELRDRFRSRRFGAAPQTQATLNQLMQAFLDHLREVEAPEGTIRAYKSDWNVHIGDQVGTVGCRVAELFHWTKVFTQLSKVKASENIVRSVAGTLGAVVTFGIETGHFTGGEGFAFAPQRANVVKKARTRAAAVRAESDRRIRLDVCPTVDDVDEYATALEAEYPGYGARLVWLCFGSGLRINEALALRIESIDLTTGVIAVDWQLDRYGNWPELKRPKGGKPREAKLWACYMDIAASLVADAQQRENDAGWLFPRHRSRTKWADQAGKLAGAARRACDWSWSHHWTRHGYASWSLAPRSAGGYELPLASASAWLGHAKPSTTQDIYVQPQPDAVEHANEVTQRKPGRSAA